MKLARSTRQAFTLIELMLVVAVIAIALTFSYPAMSKLVHRAPLTQAVIDVMEACRNARAQSILHATPMEIRIYPRDGRVEVSEVPVDVGANSAPSGGGNVTPGSAPSGDSPNSDASPSAPVKRYEPKSPFKSSAQISDEVRIEMLDVNFSDFKEAEVARVRFFPNGTCDELTFVLHSDADWRKITLEVVTGLAEVSDVR
jgi:prepilin-type N-terminal cleavage/methylation domain-containing protein